MKPRMSGTHIKMAITIHFKAIIGFDGVLKYKSQLLIVFLLSLSIGWD